MSFDFSTSTILVVGDAMLDRYWLGDATRISPEAPVPVVLIQDVQMTAGGAANVAVNASALGAGVRLMSVIGQDEAGNDLVSVLSRTSVVSDFVCDPAVQTIVKLRVMARGQQVVRVDFESRPASRVVSPLKRKFETQVADYGVVVFSDYGKGALAHIESMLAMARERGKLVLVDPKRKDWHPYRGATIITPNREEFALVAGRWGTESELERKAFVLRDELEIEALLVTRSEEGMSLFVGERHIRIPTQAREVYDVSGAGDTVIATLAAALGAGYRLEDAARLANRAAGIVVAKIGTEAVTLAELEAAG
jgi:rfaE bifunctional protein kinase chain/domain